MTSSLIVLAFDTMDEAEQVHEALVKGKKEGLVTIEDAAVVVKDAEGKVHVKNQVSRTTWAATGVGGALGLLIGTIFFARHQEKVERARANLPAGSPQGGGAYRAAAPTTD